MPQKLNSEFNYRYQVIGLTPWAKIQTLRGFLYGRKRAAALEKVQELKIKAKRAELEYMKKNGALEHVILNLEAEIMEIESALDEAYEAYRLNEEEIKILEKLLAELYEIAEPTRLHHPDGTPYTDEEMFEANAANEFTAMIGRKMYAEIIATGRPTPATLENAMSNPHTFQALKQVGLIPKETKLLLPSVDPTNIYMLPVDSENFVTQEQKNPHLYLLESKNNFTSLNYCDPKEQKEKELINRSGDN